MFKYFMARPATLQEQVKIYKTLTMVLSGEVILLSALAQYVTKQQEKQYRLLAQQYDILAKYANWEDPMIKHEMQTLLEFRKIVDPPKDDD